MNEKSVDYKGIMMLQEVLAALIYLIFDLFVGRFINGVNYLAKTIKDWVKNLYARS